MKAFTDISQSKKLAEILPLESADQTWARMAIAGANLDVPEEVQYKHNGDMPFKYYSGICTPCWSLVALLGVLPNKLQIVLAINDFQGDRKEKYVIGSVEHDKYDCYADNPVDACYELILKLHELNLL